MRTTTTLRLLLGMFTGLNLATARGEVPTHIDWAKGAGKVPGLWHGLQVAGKDRFVPVVDSHVPHYGSHSTVVRVEVRPGDNVLSPHGERSEVSGMQNAKGQPMPVTAASGHEFYGISVKLDPKWQAPEAKPSAYVWGTFFQLHGPDNLGASPSFAIMAENDFHVDLCGGDLSDGGKRTTPHGAVHHAFTDGSLNAGHWVQFLCDIVWAADNAGSVAVYRRDEGKAEWVKVLDERGLATLQYTNGQPVGEHYWKTGFYRSASAHSNVLWLGAIARGGKREDVAAAAFGKP